MSFCIKCGKELSDDARFCSSCGKSVNQTSTQSQRKTVYDGEIHKCPNCGEALGSFVSKCRACGFEIREAKAGGSIREFTAELKKLEEKGVSRSKGIFHQIISGNNKAKDNEEKINLIRSFPIPNTKEDITEFVILASSNIDAKLYGWNTQEEASASQKKVSDAWLAKLEQAYEKAKLVLDGTETFSNIQHIYDKTQHKIKRQKMQTPALIIGLAIVMVLLFVFIGIMPMNESETESDLVQIGIESTEVSDRNYEDLVVFFHSQGFTNIETRALEDLVTGWITKDGEVESVSINGETEFTSYDKFAPDAKIVITYHTFSE